MSNVLIRKKTMFESIKMSIKIIMLISSLVNIIKATYWVYVNFDLILVCIHNLLSEPVFSHLLLLIFLVFQMLALMPVPEILIQIFG